MNENGRWKIELQRNVKSLMSQVFVFCHSWYSWCAHSSVMIFRAIYVCHDANLTHVTNTKRHPTNSSWEREYGGETCFLTKYDTWRTTKNFWKRQMVSLTSLHQSSLPRLTRGNLLNTTTSSLPIKTFLYYLLHDWLMFCFGRLNKAILVPALSYYCCIMEQSFAFQYNLCGKSPVTFTWLGDWFKRDTLLIYAKNVRLLLLQRWHPQKAIKQNEKDGSEQF